MKKLSMAVLLGLGLASSHAFAQEVDDNGFYVGANYGFLTVDGDDNFDEDKSAYHLLGGYNVNSFFAIEGSYVDFGDYGNDLANADTEGYTAGIKFTLPLTEQFRIFAKGGQLWYETDYDVLGFRNSYDDDALFGGVGLSYALTSNFLITFDYTLYDTDLNFDEASENIDDTDFSTDFRFAAVGVEYRF